MKIGVVALYPTRLSSLAGKPGVRFRKRKKKTANTTLVPCRIESSNGRSKAVPELPVPEGTPAPMFRAQLTVVRAPVDKRPVVCLVLPATPDIWQGDPETLVLAPIYDDGRMMIFEFTRAFIFSLNKKKQIEFRLVAVHPVQGTIGTKTIYTFHAKLLPVAAKCMEYLAGAIDLFPAPERRPLRQDREIPDGEANLTFEPRKGGQP